MPKTVKEAVLALPPAYGATRQVIEMKAATFKDQCLQLLDRVDGEGIEIIVTKHGKPVAKLVPLDPTGPSPFGFMQGTVLESDDIVAPDPDAWGDLA